MAYQGKHTGATIDAQIGRVVDGSVVTDNTLHEITSDDTKPVTGAAVEKGILARTDSLVMKGSRNPVSGEAVAKELEDVARLVDGKLPIDNLHAPMLIFEVIWNMYNNDVPLQYSTPRAAEVARDMYAMQEDARRSIETTVMLVMSSPDIDIVYRVPLSYANGSWRGVVNDRLRTYESALLDGEENTQYIGLHCVEITLSVDTSGVVAMASKVRQIQVTSEAYRNEMQGPVYVKREQSFTEEEQAQARKNIGAASTTEYYPEMAVGTADNLRGRGEATEEIFTYRPSAGASNSIAEEGVATMRRIKGNTIVWNQVATFRNSKTLNGLTITNENNKLRVSGTLTEALPCNLLTLTDYLPQGLKRDGSKYLISLNAPDGVAYGINGYGIVNTKPHFWSANADTVFYGYISINVYVGTTVDYVFSNPHIIDLTQMFGAGNEPATVEEFRALYPNSYYPYNAGELRNLDCSGIRTVGFNQWDEQWEQGTLNGVGGGTNDTATTIRSKNYIPVIGGVDYYVGITTEGLDDTYYLAVCWYDSKKNFISRTYCNRRVITSPSNAAYLRFGTNTSSYIYGNTYNNDICINLSHTGVRNGEYEPYEERVHDIPEIAQYFPEGMRSAGAVYDEITESEVIQRVGAVDLGSLEWYGGTSSDTGYRYFFAQINGLKLGFRKLTISADYDETEYAPNNKLSKDKTIFAKVDYVGGNSPTAVVIRDDSYTHPADFKAAMSGVMLYYELAEPIVTPLPTRAINLNYPVWDWGTERAVSAKPSAPFRADIVYGFNAVDTIRMNKSDIEALFKRVVALEAKVAESEAEATAESTDI